MGPTKAPFCSKVETTTAKAAPCDSCPAPFKPCSRSVNLSLSSSHWPTCSFRHKLKLKTWRTACTAICVKLTWTRPSWHTWTSAWACGCRSPGATKKHPTNCRWSCRDGAKSWHSSMPQPIWTPYKRLHMTQKPPAHKRPKLSHANARRPPIRWPKRSAAPCNNWA